ncbi:hypothetical protein [Paenibacillus sp. URB8-2]|uniref:hypothetical protein n=1 Tax=Paenibacillus sp. URB8-2 TaxID=2741301 RepID=UPI0015BF83A7|nr:hypothetical protein [Paenibacillus sp. URB8-2]BCG57493.1 hypothetical protein PUR_09180 [Paenibacillus sp. URB8-2]
MANIQPKIIAEIDPRNPVPEICAVIMAVVPYHPAQEEAILRGVIEATEKRLKAIQPKKGAEDDDKPVSEPRRNTTDSGELGRAE